jgi:hypothetical protein
MKVVIAVAEEEMAGRCYSHLVSCFHLKSFSPMTTLAVAARGQETLLEPASTEGDLDLLQATVVASIFEMLEELASLMAAKLRSLQVQAGRPARGWGAFDDTDVCKRGD